MAAQTVATITVQRCDTISGSPTAPQVPVTGKVYNSANYWEASAPWGVVFDPDPLNALIRLFNDNPSAGRQWLATGTAVSLPSGNTEL